MNINKVLGQFLIDKGQEIAESSEPLCPIFFSKLMQVFIEAEEKKKEKKEDSPAMEKAKEVIKEQEKKVEEMSPEECMACELMNMLGLPTESLKTPGEHVSVSKPTIKIKIKKVSSQDDLDKILKEMKSGGIVDLNSANEQLGEIFDLNSILLILETPMFKSGGYIDKNKTYTDGTGHSITGLLILDTTKKNMKRYPGITEDQAAGREPVKGKDGKKYYINGDGKLIPAKEEGGELEISNEQTLEGFLAE